MDELPEIVEYIDFCSHWEANCETVRREK